MRTQSLVLGVLLVVCAITGTAGWGADPTRYGRPVQVTAYDITVTPDFDANTCRVVAECRLHNFGSTPAARVPLALLGPEATGTSVTGLGFETAGAVCGWETAAFTTTELPFASWLSDRVAVHQVSLPRSLPPQSETTLRASYTLTASDPAKSEILPPLPTDERELVLLVDYQWLPQAPASSTYAFTRYGRDKYDLRYKPTWTVRVQAPPGYRAVAISGEAAGENVWRSRVPGDLMLFVGRYRLTTVEVHGITLDIYTPPGARDVEALLAPMREMADYFRLYADAFGALRGTRLNLLYTATPDFTGHGGYLGFAMDQSMDRGTGWLAHELAHSWWGLSVTGYGVGTKFLEESLAEWSADWARNRLYGHALPRLDPPGRWRQFGLVQRSFTAGGDFGGNRVWPRFGSPAIVALDPYAQDGDRNAAYEQGPGLLTEIMDSVGEPTFLKALRTFATTYRDDSCTLDDFIASFKASTGRDIAPIFREHSTDGGVDTRLHSAYAASHLRSTRKGGGWRTEVTVLNKGTHETVCPVELQTTDGKEKRTVQVPPGEVRTLTFTTAAEVKSLAIDPRWEPLPVVGESTWRGINLPSDDPWELARRMTRDGMGGENWAWYLHALALARIGQWQACAETITTHEAQYRQALGGSRSAYTDLPVHAYLLGVALLHLGKADAAATDLPYAIDDLLDGLEGLPARLYPGSGLESAFSFAGAGVISGSDDRLSANHLLKLLTGQDFGFDPKADKQANALAVAKWKAWWMEHRSSYRVPEKLRQYPDLLPLWGT